MLGHCLLLSRPRALMSMSLVSSITLPSGCLTWTCHLPLDSSHRQFVTSCSSFVNRSTPYFRAVDSRYSRISEEGA